MDVLDLRSCPTLQFNILHEEGGARVGVWFAAPQQEAIVLLNAGQMEALRVYLNDKLAPSRATRADQALHDAAARGREKMQAAMEKAEETPAAAAPAGPEPGYEPWAVLGGQKRQRISLISTCRADQAHAADLGLEVALFDPEAARNEELWAYGRQLRARINAEKERRAKEDRAA
jgi:hypothetical protein